MFLESQCSWPRNSLYQMNNDASTTLTVKRWVLYKEESHRQAGVRSQRRIVASRTVMRPAGIGRKDLFLSSSSGSTSWFATLNCKRCNQIQKITLGRRLTSQRGAAAAANNVWSTRQYRRRESIEQHAYYRDDSRDDVRSRIPV